MHLMPFSFDRAFKAFPVLASLWIEHRSWFLSGRAHPLERSHSDSPEEQRDCPSAHLVNFWTKSCSVPCWCPGCGLVWVLGEGDGSFSCWLEVKGLIQRKGHRNCSSLCLRFYFLNFYLENEDGIS